jgi:hypothetical protein
MARTPLKNQPWKACVARIAIKRNGSGGYGESPVAGAQSFVASVDAPGLDLGGARIVWELQNQEPVVGATILVSHSAQPRWVEAEIQMRDGRRAFVVTNLTSEILATAVVPEPGTRRRN